MLKQSAHHYYNNVEFIFMVDMSNNMMFRVKTAVRCLSLLLKQLGSQSMFNILLFGSIHVPGSLV